ncbi:TPA: response regulator [Candidatus Poribacteria bacterium]|nr:response regulator [Candidatus Poribacteria bacterium]
MTKILLLEDDEMKRDILSRQLSNEGYRVVIAGNGKQVISMAQSEAPHLILIDMNLPEMNGLEVARHLKTDDITRHIPIIALIDRAILDNQGKEIEASCDDYDIKPVDFLPLHRKIQSLMNKKVHDMGPHHGSVLIVDDQDYIRNLFCMQLRREGHTVFDAANGQQALKLMREHEFDLVLLDIMMPGMNGYQVLNHLKADPSLRHIPVVVISGVEDFDSIVRCVELGADDYLFKPPRWVLLQARINACLEKKRLRDQSERLLLNILSRAIAERLKQGEHKIADSFPAVTVLFADIIDFTRLSARLSPIELVDLLNDIFSVFDRLVEKHGLEKIKTSGDDYMVAGGLPTPRKDHAEAVAEMALDMQEEIVQFKAKNGEPLRMRIGINTGPVIAGVIGEKKFIYDLWGDTVNMAKRMESEGIEGCIQVTTATYEHLRDKYLFEKRGLINVKHKGEMVTYLLVGRKVHIH